FVGGGVDDRDDGGGGGLYAGDVHADVVRGVCVDAHARGVGEVQARAVGDCGAGGGRRLRADGTARRGAHREDVRELAVGGDRLQLIREAPGGDAVLVLEADVRERPEAD